MWLMTAAASSRDARWRTSRAGLHELARFLRTARVQEVAIERPDGLVVDALLEAGFMVVVISPPQIKSLRSLVG